MEKKMNTPHIDRRKLLTSGALGALGIAGGVFLTSLHAAAKEMQGTGTDQGGPTKGGGPKPPPTPKNRKL
jgi:hypothetical protein